MKNKIGILLILISLLLITVKNIKEKININYQNNIIASIYDNHLNTKEYNSYIEIPKYNIKRLIKEGTDKKILDNNFVGTMKTENSNLTVLAGHNTNLVFHKIHYLKKDDLIYFYKDKLETYIVIKTKEIDINDYSILKDDYKSKTLILITCTKDKNKRFIVISKKINDDI